MTWFIYFFRMVQPKVGGSPSVYPQVAGATATFEMVYGEDQEEVVTTEEVGAEIKGAIGAACRTIAAGGLQIGADAVTIGAARVSMIGAAEA